MSFKVDSIDHVEVFVPDRTEAAKWYEAVLGLKVIDEFKHWAEHPQGPLMISSDGGSTKIALFTGIPSRGREVGGFHLTAFRVDSHDYLAFLDGLATTPVFNVEGEQVQAGDVVDHGEAFSIYFCDPYGNRLEVTTYDHELVRTKLERK